MDFSYLNTMLLGSTGTWLDFVHPIAVIVLAVGSIVSATFAIRAYNRTQQSREYQNYLEFKKLVSQANIYYLANPEDLQFINGWLYDRDNDAVAARDRFNFFILLNVLEAAFLSRRYGADEVYLDMKLSHLLGRLLFSYTDKDGNLQTRDPIYNALYYGGYDPRFIQHCRSKSRDFESWVQEQESMEQRNTRPRGNNEVVRTKPSFTACSALSNGLTWVGYRDMRLCAKRRRCAPENLLVMAYRSSLP